MTAYRRFDWVPNGCPDPPYANVYSCAPDEKEADDQGYRTDDACIHQLRKQKHDIVKPPSATLLSAGSLTGVSAREHAGAGMLCVGTV